MALYAIGDLHLSFTVNKPMEVFGAEWKNHVARIEKHWKKRVAPEDTVVVTGDHSWGRNLEECAADQMCIRDRSDACVLKRKQDVISH